MNIRNTSKESIRSRLLKNAAHFWGQDNIQNLDPFVKLLMEALSVELYKAYNEIQTTDARILEKITRLLTPELYVSARPAHAIAHLRMSEPGQTLDARNQFYQNLRIATQEEGILDAEYPIVFTPLDTLRLYDGDIRYLIAGNNIYKFNEQRNKLFNATAQAPLPGQKVWIGMEMNPAENLENLSCYFTFNLALEEWMYALLPSAQWSVNGYALKVRTGGSFVPAAGGTKEPEGAQSVFADYEIMRLIENDIKTHYNRYFVTIENLEEVRLQTNIFALPAALTAAFPSHEAAAGTRNIIWLEIDFPAHFTPAVLDHFYVMINAFPVINRKLQQLHHNLKDINRIIPIIPEAHEHLLSVAALSDDRGRPYYALPFKAETNSGYYSVKYGGAERFDERNAQEYLDYLSELLRDEVASFAAYGKDFVRGLATDLGKKIKLLNQKTAQDYNRFREVPSYLMVDPIDDSPANMTVEYWITNSTLANGIRAGSVLLRLQTSLLITSNAVLLTTVAGGQEMLRANERLNAYKYTLTTRNRLVTYEDIKSFCLLQLGSRIGKVMVQRGVGVGIGGQEGILATTDIILVLPATDVATEEEWMQTCADLKVQIESRAVHGNHYRVWAQRMVPVGF